MPRRVDRAANIGDARRDAGRSLVVNHAHRADFSAAIGTQPLLDRFRIGAMPPVARQKLDLQSQARRHLLPQHGEVAGLVHQHAFARRERIDERCFPRAGPGGRVDHHCTLAGLEHALHASEHRFA